MGGANLTCKVLLFAQAADAYGKSEEQLTVPCMSTAGELFQMLTKTAPSLAKLQGRCAIAMNQEICSAETKILDGCIVAILPPVSGG